MTSIFAVAVAAGALGAITAVGTANEAMIEEVRPTLSGGAQEMLSMCEQCVEYIHSHDLVVDEDLRNLPAVKVCKKISEMEGRKLRKLIVKFLESPKMSAEKMKGILSFCEGNNSRICREVREMKNNSLSGGEDFITETEMRRCAEDVSRAYRNVKMDSGDEGSWLNASDFSWGSDDEVESGVSPYSLH